MVIVPSFFEGNKYHGLVSFLLNSLTLFLSINAIQESRKQLYLGATSAFIVVMINRFGVFREEAALDFYLSFFIYLVFYAYVAFRLLKMIVATVNVKVGVLYASVIVYILIGIVGGYILMLIENIAPGSINNLELENITTPSKFFYFSFITLSTLGYGDITPISPPARSVCIILSTTGPLYLTVLVALLVSRFEHSDIH
jgi:voltage-gated potassium channel|tara:strand:+ start:394 stop:990 length:597 start_codon:yes stop_codon:yes gene_type:complete